MPRFERHRIATFFLDPEVAVEARAQRPCFGAQTRRILSLSDPLIEIGDFPLRHVHVALHFGQCNGRLGKPAVFRHQRISRILPALIDQAFVGVAQIADVAVASDISILVDPVQRPLDGDT